MEFGAKRGLPLADLIHIDLLIEKQLSKKIQNSLAKEFTSADFISKMKPTRILEVADDGDVRLETVDGLTIAFHVEGCMHISSKDLKNEKLNSMGGAVAILAEMCEKANIPKESAIHLYLRETVPRRELERVVKKATDSDFEELLKNIHGKNASVEGIRISISPTVSQVVDKKEGIYGHIGPVKINLDQLKNKETFISLLKTYLGEFDKTLTVK